MNHLYCGVVTQSQIHLVIPLFWLENGENKMSKIFYSPNQNEKADFSLPVKYFVNKNERAVYNAYVVRLLREYNPTGLYCIVFIYIL